MNPVQYTLEAETDIDAAFAYYVTVSAVLADRFLLAVRRAVDGVAAMPYLFGEVHPGVRAAPLRRFPHVVYYEPGPARTVVIAVVHGRGDPGVWQARV